MKDASPEPSPQDLVREDELDTVPAPFGMVDPDAPTHAGSPSRDGEEAEPRRLGNYELVGELARGGMGVVYRARHAELGHEVAIKLLQQRWEGNPRLRERFRLEALATARLRHPNIVAVHDVGEDGGAPYLVMDLVDGEPLSTGLPGRRPPPRRAVELCAQVARALHYAHQRAILHRDIKPSNILLDREGQPLLTDFGLAKLLDQEETGLTRTGQLLGTPSYLPPEQVESGRTPIDARADVYGLGATLYALLTGGPPFIGTTTVQVLALVAAEDAVAPSRRAPGIDRDLDTICLTCLEKEPGRRYPSALALAEDLERYLADDSILARPPTTLERLRKWTRRNRALTRVLLGSGLVLFLSLAVSTGAFLRRLQHERDAAEQARQQATLHAAAARRALSGLVGEVRDELEDLPGQELREARERLLRLAMVQLAELERLEGGARDPLVAIEAQIQIGDLGRNAGAGGEALAAYGEALTRARAQVPLQPDPARLALLRVLGRLVNLHIGQGHHEPARAAVEEGIEVSRAFVAERRAQDLPAAAPSDHLAYLLANRASLDLEAQQPDAARAALEEALGIRRGLVAELAGLERSKLCETLEGLSALEQSRGELTRARELLEESLAMRRVLLSETPERFSPRRGVLVALLQLARLLAQEGQGEAAFACREEALGLARALQAEDPRPRLRRDLASLLTDQGDALLARNELAPALPLFREAFQLVKALVAQDPHDHRLLRELSIPLTRIERIHLRRGELPEARALCEQDLDLSRRLLELSPGRTAEMDLSSALLGLAEVEQAQGEITAAEAHHQEAVELRRRILARDPGDALARQELALALAFLARGTETEAGQARSQEGTREAVELQRRVVADDPENAVAQAHLAHLLYRRAYVVQSTGELDRPLALLEEGLSLLRSLGERVPPGGVPIADFERTLAELRAAKATLEQTPETPAEHWVQAMRLGAQGDFARAHVHLEQVVRDPELRGDVQRNVLYLAACAAARVAEDAGSGPEAERLMAKALEYLREDFARRRALIARLEEALQNEAPGERREGWQRARQTLQQHIANAARDRDLQVLRTLPEFEALFAE